MTDTLYLTHAMASCSECHSHSQELTNHPWYFKKVSPSTVVLSTLGGSGTVPFLAFSLFSGMWWRCWIGGSYASRNLSIFPPFVNHRGPPGLRDEPLLYPSSAPLPASMEPWSPPFLLVFLVNK